MNKNTLALCKAEVTKIIGAYERLTGTSPGAETLAVINARVIYTLAGIIQALLKDQEAE